MFRVSELMVGRSSMQRQIFWRHWLMPARCFIPMVDCFFKSLHPVCENFMSW